MNTTTLSHHISLSRVAELAGATPQSVSNWRRRSGDFPQPVAGTERRPLFDLEEMTTWLKDNDRYDPKFGFASLLWGLMDGLRVSLPPLGALQVALSAVTWRVLSDRTVPGGFTKSGNEAHLPDTLRLPNKELSPDDFMTRLEKLAGWAEETLEEPYGSVFAPLHNDVESAGKSFLSIALPLLVKGPTDAVELEEALDEMLNRAGSQDILGRTSAHLRVLSLDVLDLQPGEAVLDAACGSGSFLLQAARTQPDSEYTGVELNEDQLLIAATSALISGTPVTLYKGDSMSADQTWAADADTFEKVFIDPPFGMRIRDAKSMQGDPRWVFGVPTQTYDFAWLQLAISRLTEGGRAAVVLPIGGLTSAAGRKIRSELLRQGAIESIIALPRGTYPGMNSAPALWLLRQPPGRDDAPAGVLLVDAADQDVTETRSLTWVSETLTEFRQCQDLSVGRPRAAVVPTVDLLSEGANLAPARWLALVALADQPTVDAAIRDVRSAVDELSGFNAPMPFTVVNKPVSFIKLADLVAGKSLKIFKGHAVPADELKESGTVPVLTPATLNGTIEPMYADGWATGAVSRLTRAGDIAVWTSPSGINASVLTEGESLAGIHIQLVRIIDDSFDPEYLAACLSSNHNTRFLEGSIVLRPNLAELEVPSLTASEQQRISQEMRNLTELQSRAKAALALIEDLSILVSDTIGEGALRI